MNYRNELLFWVQVLIRQIFVSVSVLFADCEGQIKNYVSDEYFCYYLLKNSMTEAGNILQKQM